MFPGRVMTAIQELDAAYGKDGSDTGLRSRKPDPWAFLAMSGLLALPVKQPPSPWL